MGIDEFVKYVFLFIKYLFIDTNITMLFYVFSVLLFLILAVSVSPVNLWISLRCSEVKV